MFESEDVEIQTSAVTEVEKENEDIDTSNVVGLAGGYEKFGCFKFDTRRADYSDRIGEKIGAAARCESVAEKYERLKGEIFELQRLAEIEEGRETTLFKEIVGLKTFIDSVVKPKELNGQQREALEGKAENYEIRIALIEKQISEATSTPLVEMVDKIEKQLSLLDSKNVENLVKKIKSIMADSEKLAEGSFTPELLGKVFCPLL